MKKIGIFFGSTTGNTKSAAQKIQSELGEAQLKDLKESSIKEMEEYDVLLLGASTWGFGELQHDWESVIADLSKLNLNGKKVALFGTGDQMAYPDTFVDSLGIFMMRS